MLDGFDDMTMAERRNLLWGMRDASEPHINRIRRESFEAQKHIITEGDLPASVTYPPAPSCVVQFPVYSVSEVRWPV